MFLFTPQQKIYGSILRRDFLSGLLNDPKKYLPRILAETLLSGLVANKIQNPFREALIVILNGIKIKLDFYNSRFIITPGRYIYDEYLMVLNENLSLYFDLNDFYSGDYTDFLITISRSNLFDLWLYNRNNFNLLPITNKNYWSSENFIFANYYIVNVVNNVIERDYVKRIFKIQNREYYTNIVPRFCKYYPVFEIDIFDLLYPHYKYRGYF